jgi:hypothetical protein
MHSLRTSVVGAVLLAAATLAACGGSQGSTAATPSQAAASSAGEPSNAPVTTPAPTPSSGASGGVGGDDVQAVADALVPPHATETFNSSGSGVILTVYTSTDSPDSLKSYYDSTLAAAGMKVVTTSTDSATNTTVIVFGREGDSTFGGSVGIAPDQAGGTGSTVSVTVGSAP